MKFSHRSYMQPTPKNLRKFGDGLLSIAGGLTAFAIAKDIELMAYISLSVGLIGKFLTNFFAE